MNRFLVLVSVVVAVVAGSATTASAGCVALRAHGAAVEHCW